MGRGDPAFTVNRHGWRHARAVKGNRMRSGRLRLNSLENQSSTFTWTHDATVQAAGLWRSGASAGIIAEAIGATRSSVVAKLRRLGVRRAVAKPIVSLLPPPKPKAASEAPAPPLEPLWVSIVALERGMCRYVSDEGEARFCGLPALPGSSWCQTHHRVVCVQREAAR
jgi:hypothetical protein